MTDPRYPHGLERLVIHECGHAVAAVLFGCRVTLLRATTNNAGEASCHYYVRKPTRPRVQDGLAYCGLSFGLSTELRQELEREMIISLAAEQSERYYQPQPGVHYRGPDPSELAEWRVRARAGLPVEAAELATIDDDRESRQSDAEFQIECAYAIAGPTAGSFLSWLRHEAVEFVLSRPFQRAMHALVPELAERGEIDGAEVERLVHQAIGRTPPRAAVPEAVAA